MHIVSISGFAEVDKLFGRPPKFTRADFIPIARFTEGPMVLVVNDQTPYKTLKDLVDDAKKRPNEIVFSSSGLYGALHLPTALFMKAAGIQMRHLPTNGGGPALTAILGNNAQVLVTSIAAANAQIKAGKLRALACFSEKRAASLPDVPTMKETRLRRAVLALGRPVRAQGHAGRRSIDKLREDSKKAVAHRPVQEGDRQHRRRRRLSRSARLRQILGRGRQARRGCGAGHRQGVRMTARPDEERSGQRMILRRDHIAGGVFIVAGAAVFSRMSGDLPFGTLASPGAGMMPKLVLGLLMVFGAILLSRAPAKARRSPTIAWSDFRHAATVVVVTAAATALYTMIGFVLSMTLLMFVLLYFIERRSLVARARRQHRRHRRLLLAVQHAAEIAAAAHAVLVLVAVESTIDSLMLGFSVAFQPGVLLYAFLGCVVGTLVGMLPGIGPLAGISILLAGDLRPRRHQGDRHAGRHLLRLAIRRLDHLDPDADSRRGLVGDDLHRRLRHGAEGPRRRGAVHRRGRLVHRRHLRRHRADRDRAAARRVRAAVRPAGIHRAADRRPDLPRLHVVDVARRARC